MKIMVCGPIGGVGIDKILEMREFLEREGFETVKQFSKGKDYSKIHDFRKKFNIADEFYFTKDSLPAIFWKRTK